MPKYVLTYFDAAGRAETTRHMFVHAGAEFEDKRVGGESWLAIKPNAPLKQLPILDVEGLDTICQSPAIERYVAKTVREFCVPTPRTFFFVCFASPYHLFYLLLEVNVCST